ncbi:exodeoxyribonuclease VII small subunit [Geoalkalibacter sp.]|uniref:exodeoxyribonuclease VII small subunit n=1 Tax=Geoalkalibacter sp. TaxID=3041440 RepID=UPI00272EB5BE|nr:exodeoxyribonuclease VII small subunit [Geoalkalibacter sp.]
MNDLSFEQALKNLEESVARLESGELPLEEALACFEQGVRNAQLCRKALRDVETRIELLVKDQDGNLTLRPPAEDG